MFMFRAVILISSVVVHLFDSASANDLVDSSALAKDLANNASQSVTMPAEIFEDRIECTNEASVHLANTGDSVVLHSPHSACASASFDWTIQTRSNLKLFAVFTKFYAVGSRVTVRTRENAAPNNMNSCERERCPLVVGSGYLRIVHVEQTGPDRRNMALQVLIGATEPQPETYIQTTMPPWAIVVIALLALLVLLCSCCNWYNVKRKVHNSRQKAEFVRADWSEDIHLSSNDSERPNVINGKVAERRTSLTEAVVHVHAPLSADSDQISAPCLDHHNSTELVT